MAGLEGVRLGSCVILRRIGGGGMGDVYLAEQPELGRQVAVKVIRGLGTSEATPDAIAQASRQFAQEARAVAALEHPHILPVYDYGEQVGIHYLVMPYIPEGSLMAALTPVAALTSGPRKRLALPLPLVLAVELVDQTAQALQYAHDRGLIHRDVKPHNLLVRWLADPTGQEIPVPHVLLADFGLARFLAELSSQTGMTGTPLYSAPEQFQGHPVPATDQYALACMAYLLVTGRHPFEGDALSLMYQHLQEVPPPPSSANPTLDRAVDAALLRALAKDPARRFARVAEFAAALRQVALAGAASTLLAASGPPTMTEPAPLATEGVSGMTAILPDPAQEWTAPEVRSRSATAPALEQLPSPMQAGAVTEVASGHLPDSDAPTERSSGQRLGPAPAYGRDVAPPRALPYGDLVSPHLPTPRPPARGAAHPLRRRLADTPGRRGRVLVFAALMVLGATAGVLVLTQNQGLPLLGFFAQQPTPTLTATTALLASPGPTSTSPSTATSTPPAPTATPVPPFTYYVSPRGHYTVSYPAVWGAHDDSGNGTLELGDFYPGATAPGQVVYAGIYLQVGTYRTDTNVQIVDNAGSFLGVGLVTPIGGRRDFRLGGGSCERGDFAIPASSSYGVQMHAIILGCHASAGEYEASFVCPQSLYAAEDTTHFEPMITSMRFTT